MTKRMMITYTLATAACGAFYLFGREIMIQQEPSGEMTVSTLTLNYILLFVIAGAISPWISVRLPFLKRFKRSTASGIVMLTLVSVLLIVLTLVGMPMRWSQ